MEVGHLSDVDLDRLAHYLGELEILPSRDVEARWYFGFSFFFRRVERTLKLDHGYSCILDKLNFADPRLVFIFLKLFVDLLQQKMSTVIDRHLLIRLKAILSHILGLGT